jgi:hypothetical protein
MEVPDALVRPICDKIYDIGRCCSVGEVGWRIYGRNV